MTTIRLETPIDAPAERVFDLARSVTLRENALQSYHLRATAGVTGDLQRPGSSIAWSVRFFGVPVSYTMKLVTYSRPRHFRERMVEGPFERLLHDRFFEPREEGGTLLRDVYTFESPLGPLGDVADSVYLEGYLGELLERVNAELRYAAETNRWRGYLGE
ncbi:SRPBCC family protein [Halomarina halobia]|uniref:SRPBCC family protein n=1 Tax=Halomarina halobia TaxID=3033386 RepID=A0ABD6AB63_9EURY|nr:SRPBCC family protein [Halomarina sp. PSR21]